MLKLILFDSKAPGQHDTFRVDDHEVQVIGRKAPRLLIPDTRVSRAHAEVRVQNGVWVIRDMGSANGTLVNNRLIDGICELEEDDVIQVGRATLLVAVAQIAPQIAPQVRPSEPPAAFVHPQSPENLDDTAAGGDPLHDTASHALTDGGENDQDQALEPDQDHAESDPVHAAAPTTPPQEPAEPPTPADLHDDTASDADDPLRPDILGQDDQDIAADDQDGADDQNEAEDEADNDAHHDAHHQDASDDAANQDVAADDRDDSDDLGEAEPPLGHDTPQAPELTALRLANYDVLDDDELAEALAADASPQLTADDTPMSMDALDPDSELPPDDGSLLVDLLPDFSADLEGDLDEDPEEDPAPTPNQAPTADRAAHPPSDVEKPADIPAAFTPLSDDADLDDPQPRRGLASSDSRLVTPAPESALDASRTVHGFPWRSTAAAVVTLAAVGVGVYLSTPSPGAGPLTDATGTPPLPQPPAAADIDTGPAPASPDVPPARRGRLSPFDAGPVLTTRVPTPHTPRNPAPTPAPTLQPDPTPAQTTPTPLPAPARAIPAAPVPVAPVPAAPRTDPVAAAPDTSADTVTPAIIAAATPPAATPEQPLAAATPAPTAASTPDAAPDAAPDATSDATPTTTDTPLPSATAPATANLIEPARAPLHEPPAAPLQGDAAAARDTTPPLTALVAVPGARRVVYVVDASGSMVDSMNQGVLTWLETQIGGLHPTDTFSVIFFRDDELLETPPLGLKPGHQAQQTKALDWMAPESGNMRPRGRSRPLAAIRRATSYGASEIVLLTDDNFGLRSGEDVSPDAIAELLHPADPDTATPTVHAVQFFYEDSGGRLQAISDRFDGRYEFVEEPPFDARPALDDLLGG